MTHLFELLNWHVHFSTPDGVVTAVNGVSLSVQRGECFAIVGESGSGKSQTVLSAFGLMARNGTTSGAALYNGKTFEPQNILGKRVGFIFQDPLTSLTPHLTVGGQMMETLRRFENSSGSDAKKTCLALLDRCRISERRGRVRLFTTRPTGRHT